MNGQDFGSEEDHQDQGIAVAVDEAVSRSEELNVSVSNTSCPAKLKMVCFKNMDWVHRLSVEPALLVVMITMGMTNGVSIQFVQHRIYENYNITGGSGGGPCSNETSNQTAAEEAAMAELNGFNVISGFVGGLPALFVTLIVSAASDRVGRKLPLLLPVAGMLCGTCVFLLVALLHLSVIVLLVSNIVLSFTGGYALFFSGCSGYIADTTAKEDRTFLFALLFTMALVGSGIASIAAGYWIQGGSFTDPFWLAFALQLAILLYLIFWVPESVHLKPSEDGSSSTKSSPSSKLSAVRKGLSGIISVAEKGRRVWLLLALTVLFVSMSIFGAINSVLFVRLLSKPFCWSSVLIGYFNASKPFINGLGLTLGSRYLTKCLQDYAIIQLGLLSTVGMLVVICISTETYGMFLVNVVGCLHALPPAILMAKMSKRIEPTLQGALFSLTGTTESLANLLGPFLLGLVYQSTLTSFPLAVFIVMIGLTAFTIAVVGVLMVMECRTKLDYQELTGNEGEEVPYEGY